MSWDGLYPLAKGTQCNVTPMANCLQLILNLTNPKIEPVLLTQRTVASTRLN